MPSHPNDIFSEMLEKFILECDMLNAQNHPSAIELIKAYEDSKTRLTLLGILARLDNRLKKYGDKL